MPLESYLFSYLQSYYVPSSNGGPMPLEQQLYTFFLLSLAAVLSMVIGLDREQREKSAGLRTHMLTGVGACMFTLISANGFDGGDPSRVASNVVTGIGFLGAGTIYRSGQRVRALTTAASIWATAAIGVAVGAGMWLVGILATLLIWFILAILNRKGFYQLIVEGPTRRPDPHDEEDAIDDD